MSTHAPISGLRLIRRTLLALCAVVAVLGLVTGWSFSEVRQAGRDNCERIHTLTATLDRMIADSRKSLDAYVADGTITPGQRDRELARIRRQRVELAGADCPPRKVGS